VLDPARTENAIAIKNGLIFVGLYRFIM
jgi:hypothetical protein